MHRQFGLELTDPPTSCSELAPFRGAQAGLDAPVDPVLAPPVVDRLLSDPEILGDLRNAAAGRDQIQHAAAKLRRISPSPHVVLLEDNNPRVQKSGSTQPGADHS